MAVGYRCGEDMERAGRNLFDLVMCPDLNLTLNTDRNPKYPLPLASLTEVGITKVLLFTKEKSLPLSFLFLELDMF